MMSFDLFGFDFIPIDGIFGFWIGTITNWNSDNKRSLLCVHYDNGCLRFELLFIRVGRFHG